MCLILILAGLKYSFGLESVIDIGLHDESFYLGGGVDILSRGLPSPDWGPLYSLWYYLVSFFIKSNSELYYFNYYVQIIFLPFLLFLFLRVKKVSVHYSLFFSFLFLISYANLMTWPRVYHFLLLFLLFVFLVSSKLNSRWKLFFNTLSLFFASYIRPEFFLSFLILALFFIFSKVKKKDFIVITVFFLLTFVVFWILGNPFGGGRSFAAFRDHFCVNWVAWSGSGFDPWKDCLAIMKVNFGDANTVLGCFFANPLMVLKHIFFNFFNFFKFGFGLFFVHSNLLIPTPYSGDVSLFALASLNKISIGTSFLCEAVMLFLGVIFLFGYKFKQEHNVWCANFKKIKNEIIFLSVCIFPTAISCILIFPRPHYLLCLFLFLFVMVLMIVGRDDGRGKSFKEFLYLGVVLLLITPKMSVLQAMPTKYCGDRVVSTLSTIRNLNIEEDVKIMSSGGDYSLYLNDNFSFTSSYQKGKLTFQDFWEEEKFDIVVVTPRLMKSTDFKGDETWFAFLESFEQNGYCKIKTKYKLRYLLVKNQLIKDCF